MPLPSTASCCCCTLMSLLVHINWWRLPMHSVSHSSSVKGNGETKPGERAQWRISPKTASENYSNLFNRASNAPHDWKKNFWTLPLLRCVDAASLSLAEHFPLHPLCAFVLVLRRSLVVVFVVNQECTNQILGDSERERISRDVVKWLLRLLLF